MQNLAQTRCHNSVADFLELFPIPPVAARQNYHPLPPRDALRLSYFFNICSIEEVMEIVCFGCGPVGQSAILRDAVSGNAIQDCGHCRRAGHKSRSGVLHFRKFYTCS